MYRYGEFNEKVARIRKERTKGINQTRLDDEFDCDMHEDEE
jgi:hypothetical protein